MNKNFLLLVILLSSLNLFSQIDLKLRFSLNQKFTHEVVINNTVKIKKSNSDLNETVYSTTHFYFNTEVVKISSDSNYTFEFVVKRVTMSLIESEDKKEFYDSDAKKNNKFQKETDASLQEVIGKKIQVTYNKYGRILKKDENVPNIAEMLFLELPKNPIKQNEGWETEVNTTITEIETKTISKNRFEKLENGLICGTSVAEIDFDMLKFKEPLTSNFKINKESGLLMYSKSKGVTEMFGMMEMTIEIETFVR